jgi:uncharacterized membrane protein
MRIALALLFTFLLASFATQAAEKTRVLYVGGDWKSQLPNFQGKTPLRGHFVKQEVEKAAPGRFEFTLWTSYEFLQYGDSETLKNFDVLVVGDVMGQSVLPRLVKGVTGFVEGGGGLWYCDNHKAFMFYEKERSFEAVLPIEILPFRAYGPEDNQPRCGEGAVKPVIAAADHPVVKGLDWASAPAIRGGDKWGPGYGKVKDGATVLARSPGGKDIWVGWEKGKGRALWTGGVFANDELSEDFVKWPQFGQFSAQILTWLAEKSTYPRAALKDAVAEGTLVVDTSKKGPVATSKHFGIHGQEDCPGGSYPMKDADLALYQALKLDNGFARTSSFMGIKKLKDNQSEDDGTDLTTFDAAKYDWTNTDVVVKDLERIKADPVFLYWCPWWGPNWPDPARYTKYFAASIEHVNGKPGTPEYKPRMEYFEIMNEPNIGPAPEVLNRYTAFFNHAVEKLRPRYPGVKYGCGGFNEWTYVQAIIDQCGKNLDWFSRHPYGHTGEAVFFLQDRYAEHAKAKGIPDLKFIVTEWDFWIYGEPAFDYLMMRWKPMLDRADACLGSLHYRWREYQEGGYVFGIHGEDFKGKYGELPPEWPNPGKDKPITYRYNAFWIMRDYRGPQFDTKMEVPALRGAVAANAAEYAERVAKPVDLSTRAYAVASCDGKQFNVVVHYGYAAADAGKGETYGKLKLRVQAPIPPEVKGRTLVIARADCRKTTEEAAIEIKGDTLDQTIEIPAQSAVSLTVK